MGLDDVLSSLKDHSSKISLKSFRSGSERLSSSLSAAVKSQSSKVEAISSDIVQRFQNDLYAWNTNPSLYALKKEIKPLLKWSSSTKHEEEEEYERKVVFAESLCPKPRQPNREEIESIVDKFLKVITPCEDEESHSNTTRRSFRHMRNYNFYRRNDRELIRHRLATESVCSGDQETESSPIATDAASSSRNGLHSRLQGGMNLQICFMNETASDYEDEEPQEEQRLHPQRTATASMISPVADGGPLKEDILGKKMVSAQSKDSDIERRVWSTSCGPVTPAAEGFQQRQQQLQMEARESLQLAQQLAHWQTRQQRASCTSPTTDVIRTALSKIGVSCSDTRRRASRPILTDMNIAQLQVIVNDIHSRIELLNDELVRCLMERDEAHMDQDSRLVHIEDLTSYFGQKQQRLQDKPQMTPPSARPH